MTEIAGLKNIMETLSPAAAILLQEYISPSKVSAAERTHSAASHGGVGGGMERELWEELNFSDAIQKTPDRGSPDLWAAEVCDDGGPARARSHCRFVLPLIRFPPDSLTYLVPLCLRQQCD